MKRLFLTLMTISILSLSLNAQIRTYTTSEKIDNTIVTVTTIDYVKVNKREMRKQKRAEKKAEKKRLKEIKKLYKQQQKELKKFGYSN